LRILAADGPGRVQHGNWSAHNRFKLVRTSVQNQELP
jgi:hypothetical protein